MVSIKLRELSVEMEIVKTDENMTMEQAEGIAIGYLLGKIDEYRIAKITNLVAATMGDHWHVWVELTL